MSASAPRQDRLPRGTLILAGVMITFAVGATAAVRIAGIPPAASPTLMRTQAHVAAVSSRQLRFVDRADGAVIIEDVGPNGVHAGTAAIIKAGEQTGFIRGVVRSLARERRMSGIGEQPPFTLTLWHNGQLSLTDSATGRSIEMTAFGSDNRAAFAALLPMPVAGRVPS